MAAINHPAYLEEKRHLEGTLRIISEETELAERDYETATEALARARIADPDGVGGELPVREMLYTRVKQTLTNMRAAYLKPYFTRIDFTETGAGSKTYYIGKYGVLRSKDLESEVVDWRAPVANLYYSGQIGPLTYSAPDGEIEGELTLKRQFGIDGGELTAILDADIVTQDEYLKGVLSATTGDRLKEIITTIQAEQNYVIRYPLDKNLVVQGVAGSGKTTIALHRIAYLLYTYQDRLRPDNMLILAPSPLFLNFIAQVLPDLGVENAHQTTFRRFIENYLGEYAPPMADVDRLSGAVNMSGGELADMTRCLRYKGSKDMLEKLDKWLDGFEQTFIPEGDIKFGPVTIFTGEELRRFILVDEKPFPLKRRIDELEKQVKYRTDGAVKRINNWYARELDRRIMELPQKVDGVEERAKRAEALRLSLKKRQEETKRLARTFRKSVPAMFGDMNPIALYKKFLGDMVGMGGDAAMAARMSLDSGRIEAEDLAPITVIAMRVLELPRPDIRHIVIDEAQDFNALEVSLLKRIARSATFTVVGDLMQGIAAYRGIADWSELTEGVFESRAVTHQLVTSYRSTVEIMDFASRVNRNMPVKGLESAKPVLRHGDVPLLSEGGAEEAANLALKWADEGLSSVAVMSRSREALNALNEKYGWTVLDMNADSYPTGIVLAPADSVKGLEFDGVIVMDASEDMYPMRELDARLLYVCLTRALHRMAVFYSGAPTRLISDGE